MKHDITASNGDIVVLDLPLILSTKQLIVFDQIVAALKTFNAGKRATVAKLNAEINT